MLLAFRISIVASVLVINLPSLYDCSVLGSSDYPKINTTELKVINKFDKEWLKLCSHEKCLPKCCPIGQILLKNMTCSTNEISFKFIEGIEKLTDYTSVHNKTDFEISPNLTLVIGLTTCIVNKTDFYYLNPMDEEQEFKILKTGNLFEFDSKTETAASDYCLEYVQKFNRTVSVNCFFMEEETDDLGFTYYPLGMLISEVFVVATFSVYAFLPELRNLHGLSLMCHVFSLAIGYFLLALIHMRLIWVESGDLCTITAYIVIFAFLSSFFWLNVMCFDIWWVFSGYRPPAAGSKKELEKKKFLFYSIYSWGLATLIFVVILVMEMPWIPKHFIRPEFGYDRCWFKTSEAEFYYFYLPLAFILSSNLLFFILTTCRILKISKETKVLTHGENKRHEEHERKRFVLYLKLFLVMGMNWIAELFSFFYPELKNLWYITDATNTLQGVFIFLIFVWKRRILRLLKLKFRATFLSSNGLSKRPSKSTSLMTHQTSITSTCDSIKMKSVSSSPNVNVSKTPM